MGIKWEGKECHKLFCNCWEFFPEKRLYDINIDHKDINFNCDCISRDEYMQKLSTYMYEYEQRGDRVKEMRGGETEREYE